jgi:hypothetical protein
MKTIIVTATFNNATNECVHVLRTPDTHTCGLRYLQTLNSISAEKNSTIIFPLPIDFISHFLKDKNDKNENGKQD